MDGAMLRAASLRSGVPGVLSGAGGGGRGHCSSPGSPRISLSMEPSHKHNNRLRRVMSENDVVAVGRGIGGAVSRSCSSGSTPKDEEDQLVIWSTTFETEKYIQRRMADGVSSGTIGFQMGGCGDGFKGGSGYGSGGGSDNGRKLSEYYENTLRMNPGDPLLLRNYARHLHEVVGNTERAEEYYGRAILADPEDGEVLSMYAKLIWEVQGDGERAKSYHERAVSTTPDNCAVLGSFAQFLWESMEEEEEEEAAKRGVADTATVMVAAF